MLISVAPSEAALPLIATAVPSLVPEGFAALVAVPVKDLAALAAPLPLQTTDLPVAGDSGGPQPDLTPPNVAMIEASDIFLPTLPPSHDFPFDVPAVVRGEAVATSTTDLPDGRALEHSDADDEAPVILEGDVLEASPLHADPLLTLAVPPVVADQADETQEPAQSSTEVATSIRKADQSPILLQPGAPTMATPVAPQAGEDPATSVVAPALGRPASSSPAETVPESNAKPHHNAPTPPVTAPTTQAGANPSSSTTARMEQTQPPAIAFHSPRFVEDVAVAIVRQAPGKDSAETMVLIIEPADLGRIQVKLQFDPETGVQAVVSADQAQVLERLRNGAGELHRALVEAAGRTDLAPPKFEARNDGAASLAGGGAGAFGGGQGGNSGQGQGGHSPTFQRRQSFDAAMLTATQSHRPLAIAAGRVDLIA